jgi:glucokinase
VNQPAQRVLDRLIEVARQVAGNEQPAAIGIAAPGPLDPQAGVIHHALTLPGWQDVPLAKLVSEAFGGAPVFMQNDANLAALAEYHLGAARGCDPALYLTISTGIGGGAVIGGQLFTGWHGLAIEPGHIRLLLPDGKLYRLEELASGTGIAEMARRRLWSSAEPSTLRALTVIDGAAVGDAARQGDSVARAVITAAGQHLGIGLVSLLHLFNPRVIVVGGSVATLGDLLFDPARGVIRENLLHPGFWADDLIRPAQLGDDVCLYGAAYYAAQQMAQG